MYSTLAPSLKRLVIFLASLVLAVSFSLLAVAWSGPPSSPPNGNPEVITVGEVDQVKVGDLAVQVLIADRICIRDKCLTEWPEF